MTPSSNKIKCGWLLLGMALVCGWGWPPAPRLRPSMVASCARPVELRGMGVGCVAIQVPPGMRLGWAGDHWVRDRMAPERLAALGVVVDVNRASLDELASLDGVGPRLAERIVAARSRRLFASVDELARVPGVGAAKLRKMASRLFIDDAVDGAPADGL